MTDTFEVAITIRTCEIQYHCSVVKYFANMNGFCLFKVVPLPEDDGVAWNIDRTDELWGGGGVVGKADEVSLWNFVHSEGYVCISFRCARSAPHCVAQELARNFPLSSVAMSYANTAKGVTGFLAFNKNKTYDFERAWCWASESEQYRARYKKLHWCLTQTWPLPL